MKPNIQIDNVVREMTDEEYETLLASGWTPGEQNAPTIVEEEDNDAPVADSSSGPSAD